MKIVLLALLTVGVVLFSLLPSVLPTGPSGPISDTSSGGGLHQKVVHFAYVSQIGGMVGGSTAVNNSQYVGITGLVQISREETNGVLHLLQIGHTDTKAFFDDVGLKSNFIKQKNRSVEQGRGLEVSEYYAPKTFLCYSGPPKGDFKYSYYRKNELTDDAKAFVNKVDKIIAELELSCAKKGLYARAQRIPDPELNFIEPDIYLQDISLSAKHMLHRIIENEMALIRIGEETEAIRLENDHKLIPDRPIYVQTGNLIYLIITYRFISQRCH
jgi:hypothetical protein